MISSLLWAAVAAAEPPEAPPADEIEVVGRRPAGTTELEVDELARPGDGLEDVLATAAGVQVRRLGGLGAFAGVSLRGTAFRQSLVRLDGVPLNPDGVEAVDLSQWPLAGIASIRVIRGRPPATVGAAPIGGVIDLVSRPAPRVTSVQVAGGSFASARGSAVLGRPWAGPVPGDALVAVDGFTTRGRFRFLDDGGTRYVTGDDALVLRDNNARRQAAALVRVRLRPGPSSATLLATGATRHEGLPGPIGVPQQATSLRTDRLLVSAGGAHDGAGGRVEARAWWLARREQLADPEGELLRSGRPAPVQRDAYDTVGVQASLDRRLGERLRLRGSVDARREAFARRTGSRRGERYGLGGAVDVPWSPLRDLREVPDRGSQGAVLPSLAVQAFADRPVGAWASVAAGFRPPDLGELYGDRGALVGNPDLRPERALKQELGARLSVDGSVAVQAEATAFLTLARDAIGWLQNTQRTLTAVNFGRTRTAGGELSVSVDHRERVGAVLRGSLVHARQTAPEELRGRPVPFVAPWRGWGRLWGQPWAWLRLGADVDHTPAVPVDRQGITVLPPRTLIGAHVEVSPVPRWTVSIDVRNLANVRTGQILRDPLSAADDARIPAPISDFVGYPLPGRAVWAAIRYQLP